MANEATSHQQWFGPIPTLRSGNWSIGLQGNTQFSVNLKLKEASSNHDVCVPVFFLVLTLLR